MSTIHGYHAHVYFDAETLEQAHALCEQAHNKFAVEMGRVHERPVGPHPMCSCQLAFGPDDFGKVVPWLSLNRGGLIVFVHAETGDDIADHTEHALWMGAMMALDLSALE